MRVIVTNQGQNQGPTPQPSPPPLFDAGKFNIRDGDVMYVGDLPQAQGTLVGFRLIDGAFARGADLTYADWVLYNRDEIKAWLDAQPVEKAAAKDYAGIAAQLGIASPRGVSGLR